MFFIHLKLVIKAVLNLIKSERFFTYTSYYKRDKGKRCEYAFNVKNNKRFGIVVQGPIVSDNDFTVETLKIYRKNFPSAILILSTWRDSPNLFNKLNHLDVHIIRNEKPLTHGISNINLQIKSSYEGIRLAKELGVEYVVKTRSDQRIYSASLDSYLFSLLGEFPLTVNNGVQKKRLISISLNTFKLRMYGISDMFLFGYVDDMLLYWGVPFDLRDNSKKGITTPGHTYKQFSKWRICETYLCTEFLKKTNRTVEYTLYDSYKVIKDLFIIIDASAIQLLWVKYSLDNSNLLLMKELSFNDWLVLKNSFENIDINESKIDKIIS